MAEERASTAVGARRGSRMAVAGVVLGVASILLGIVSILGWVLGLAAIVVAGLAVKWGAPRRGVAIWGSWLGLAGSVVSMLVFALALTGH